MKSGYLPYGNCDSLRSAVHTDPRWACTHMNRIEFSADSNVHPGCACEPSPAATSSGVRQRAPERCHARHRTTYCGLQQRQLPGPLFARAAGREPWHVPPPSTCCLGKRQPPSSVAAVALLLPNLRARLRVLDGRSWQGLLWLMKGSRVTGEKYVGQELTS